MTEIGFYLSLDQDCDGAGRVGCLYIFLQPYYITIRRTFLEKAIWRPLY